MEYKWKEIGKTNMLVVKGQSQTAVATFQRARLQLFSPNRPACLSITLQAINIKDEIVTTAMWFEEKRHQREKAQQRRTNQAMSHNLTMNNNMGMSNMGMSNITAMNNTQR